MTVPRPLVLSMDLVPRFLVPSDEADIGHAIELGPNDDRFMLPTYVGRRANLPGLEGLTTACRVGRSQAYADVWNAALRWPFAANLNNLAVLLVLSGKWGDAEGTIREAIENFDAISDFPEALRGIAVARYNLAVLCHHIRNWSGLREEAAGARAQLGAVPISEWDEDSFLVQAALDALDLTGY